MLVTTRNEVYPPMLHVSLVWHSTSQVWRAVIRIHRSRIHSDRLQKQGRSAVMYVSSFWHNASFQVSNHRKPLPTPVTWKVMRKHPLVRNLKFVVYVIIQELPEIAIANIKYLSMTMLGIPVNNVDTTQRLRVYWRGLIQWSMKKFSMNVTNVVWKCLQRCSTTTQTNHPQWNKVFVCFIWLPNFNSRNPEAT